MKFDIKIYGITDRKDQILKNKEILNLADSDVNMIEKDGKFCYDLAKQTWLLPWEEDVTHRLVLQDDAELCPDFKRRLQEVIEARPDDIIFLTALDFDKECEEANNLESCYTPLRYAIQGCAIVIPTKYIKDVFDWSEKIYGLHAMETGEMHEDMAIVRYGIKHRLKVLITVPSLTQHIGDHSQLFGYTNPTRTAYFKDWDKADYTNSKISY